MAGCTRLQLMTSDDLVADIDSALQSGDYKRAAYLIEHAPAEHPQQEGIQAQSSLLEREVRQFLGSTRKEALALASNREWEQAYNLLDDASRRLPPNADFDDTLALVHEREDALMERTTSRILLGEARWLLEQQPQLATLADITRSDARRMTRDIERRKVELAADLTRRGEQFAADEDWQNARDYLLTARRLSGSSEPGESEKKAEQKVASASYKAAQKRMKEQVAEGESRLQRYQANNSSGVLDRLEQQANSLARRRFTEALDAGDGLYSRGKYQQAYDVWQEVVPIEPDNPDLKKKLERVQKVLQNLENLKDKPAQP